MYGDTYISTSVSQYATHSAPCSVWRPPSSTVPSTPCWTAPHLLCYGDPRAGSQARQLRPYESFPKGVLRSPWAGAKRRGAARRIRETWAHQPNQYPVFITSKRSVSMPLTYLITSSSDKHSRVGFRLTLSNSDGSREVQFVLS